MRSHAPECKCLRFRTSSRQTGNFFVLRVLRNLPDSESVNDMRGILSPDDRQISAAIRSTVARHGIKHRWIADKLDIPPAQFGRRIRGEAKFTTPQIIGIAQVLGITETELLADVTGRAAGNSGQHSVSSAPEGESESRERLDRPATRHEGEV